MATLIGWNLAALLKERGMSQKELAEAAGPTPASVSRYVNGGCRGLPRSPRCRAPSGSNRRTSSEPPAIRSWMTPCTT